MRLQESPHPFTGTATEAIREWVHIAELCTKNQKNIRWDALTIIQWAFKNTQELRKNYRERATLDKDMSDWDHFNSELIYHCVNILSKEKPEQKLLALQDTGTIDEYLNEVISLESNAQIGPAFLRTTLTNNVRPSLKRRIVESRKQPISWPHWIEWVRDMGRKDQAASHRLKDRVATSSTSTRRDRLTTNQVNTPRSIVLFMVLSALQSARADRI